MKYIIFNYSFPVIFPDDIHHIQVANGLREYKPTSGGHMECGLNGDDELNAYVFDKAETIGMEPGDDDEEILTNFLNETE